MEEQVINTKLKIYIRELAGHRGCGTQILVKMAKGCVNKQMKCEGRDFLFTTGIAVRKSYVSYHVGEATRTGAEQVLVYLAA